jgi:GMP synthase (glutamine-hydrolysing)
MSKVLTLQHIECEDLGTFELPLKERGFQPHLIAPFKGDILPEDLKEFKALIILGGPIGVYEQDKYPYLKKEILLIRKALNLALPTLGICLGAQLLAAAAGATVYKGKAKEIGWFKISLTDDGLHDYALHVLGKEPFVFQWHGDTFELPEGSIRLASSVLFKNQAFRIGDATYGLQFHLEVTEKMIKEWLAEYEQEVNSLQELIDPDKILRESQEMAAALTTCSKEFLSRFLDSIS